MSLQAISNSPKAFCFSAYSSTICSSGISLYLLRCKLYQGYAFKKVLDEVGHVCTFYPRSSCFQWDAPTKTRPGPRSRLTSARWRLLGAGRRVECAKVRSSAKRLALRIWLGRACALLAPDTSCAGLHEERDSPAAGTLNSCRLSEVVGSLLEIYSGSKVRRLVCLEIS